MGVDYIAADADVRSDRHAAPPASRGDAELPMGQPLYEESNGSYGNGDAQDLSGELAERLKALGYL